MTFETKEQGDGPFCLDMLCSEHGHYKIRRDLTITGSLRVNVWPFRDQPMVHVAEYCCGPNPLVSLVVRQLLVKVMASWDESLGLVDVERRLPAHTVVDGRQCRPITTDPALTTRLCEMAGVEPGAVLTLWEMLK